MKKLFIASVFSFALINTAQAISNIWHGGYAQGYSENSIENGKGQIFRVTCDVGATENDNRHNVTFISGHKEYSNDDEKINIQILFDNGEVSYIPDIESLKNPPTLTEQQWNIFTYNLPMAKKFDVYINDKKVATFKPKNSKILRDMGCDIRY